MVEGAGCFNPSEQLCVTRVDHRVTHIRSNFSTIILNISYIVVICKNFQVEFEWLRQFWMQGVQRAKERDRYWKQPMEELEQAWKQMELMVRSSYRLLIVHIALEGEGSQI